MLKIIFVLVINAYHGGATTIDFATLQQCEAAKAQIAKETKSGASLGMACVEKQVMPKKTRCKIINNFSYQNLKGNSNAHNLDGYPYPIELECSEE